MRQITKKYSVIPVGSLQESRPMDVPDSLLEKISDVAAKALTQAGMTPATITVGIEMTCTVLLPPKAPAGDDLGVKPSDATQG